jgi:hypothetical protein
MNLFITLLLYFFIMSYNTTIIASNNLSLSSEKLKENYFIKLNKHQTKLSLFRQNLMKHEDD